MISQIIHALQNSLVSDKYQDQKQGQHVRNENIKSLINAKESRESRSKIQETQDSQAIKTVDEEDKREQNKESRQQQKEQSEEKKTLGSGLKYILDDCSLADCNANNTAESTRFVGSIIDKKV